MAALSSLSTLIVQQIPAVNDLLAERIVLETMRDFCTYTRQWRSSQDLTVTAGTLNVVVTPPTDGELVDVVTCERDGEPILKKAHNQIKAIVPRWRTQPGAPKYVTIGDALNELYFVPTSETTLTAEMDTRLAWKPILAATEIDDLLLSRHSDCFINGALGRLFVQPDQVWTDTTRANYYNELYEDAKELARSQAEDSHMTGVVRKIKYGGL